jgi:hypothetical protein
MDVIDPVAGKLSIFPEPGVLFPWAEWFLPTVLIPPYVRLPPQNAGSFSTPGNICSFSASIRHIRRHERTDIQANPVINIRFPTNRLFFDRFAPASAIFEFGKTQPYGNLRRKAV